MATPIRIEEVTLSGHPGAMAGYRSGPSDEASEITRARFENGNRPSPKLQRRLDKLTAEKCELRRENQELRDVLEKYEETIRRYKAALIAARGKQ